MPASETSIIGLEALRATTAMAEDLPSHGAARRMGDGNVRWQALRRFSGTLRQSSCQPCTSSGRVAAKRSSRNSCAIV